MQPDIMVNYLAIGICVLVAVPIGFLWFGPVFGKLWAKQMGMEHIPQPTGKDMAKSVILFAFGSLLIAGVLAHAIAVWRPSAWNAGVDEAGLGLRTERRILDLAWILRSASAGPRCMGTEGLDSRCDQFKL